MFCSVLVNINRKRLLKIKYLKILYSQELDGFLNSFLFLLEPFKVINFLKGLGGGGLDGSTTKNTF